MMFFRQKILRNIQTNDCFDNITKESPQITFKKKKNADVEEWPFNQPMYLILNLAIGGNWGGAIDDSIFPVSLQFKYVNVYERSE